MESPLISWILHALPFVFIGAVVLYLFLRNNAARKHQAQGVLLLQAMRMLITHIQKHRGLSSGVLNGERSLKPQLEDIQRQVSRDFDHISATGEWVKAQQDWQLITQHWARLAGNVYKLEAMRSIDQHNRLVKNILVFVDLIASTHFLNSASSQRSASWRDLLTLSELIGQVRANGTAVTAARAEGDDQKALKAQKNLSVLVQEVFATLEEPRCRMGLDEHTLQAILDFLNYVEETMEDSHSMVSVREFYQRASAVMDVVFDCFDQQLSWISRRLSSRLA